MQGHGRIIAPDFCVAHREANSGLSTLNRTKSILSIYHQQRQLQKQRGMCLNDTYPFCQQPLSGNCHSICFSKPVLWTVTPWAVFFYGASAPRRECGVRRREPLCGATGVYSIKRGTPLRRAQWGGEKTAPVGAVFILFDPSASKRALFRCSPANPKGFAGKDHFRYCASSSLWSQRSQVRSRSGRPMWP